MQLMASCRIDFALQELKMPKVKANRYVSNLSLAVPRHIHRAARLKALRSGAPSFGAYVAMLLDQAPERVTAAQSIQMFSVELLLDANRDGAGHANLFDERTRITVSAS